MKLLRFNLLILIVLISSFSAWNIAQALSLDGNCSNWKVGTLTDSGGMNREAEAKAICANLGKSGDAITVFDPRNQSCLLCAREDWTPGSPSVNAAKTVQVPDVVGLMYREALTRLKEAGLKPRVGKASSPLTLNPRQKVLEQETPAGARVSRGETVVINFSKEGFKMPPTLSNPNLPKQTLPDVLTREQYNRVRMPDVVGMDYKKAAGKLKSVGLKPVYKLGMSPSDKKRAKTVMSTSAKANSTLNVGTEIIVTVYDSYRDPGKIVKRDPVSGFGGSDTSPSGKFKCDTGIPGVIVESSGPIYPDRKNGIVQVDKAEAKNYVCRYKTKGGNQHVAVISFFDKLPATANGKNWKDHMCAIYALGKGEIPVFINQQGGVGLSDTVGRENVMRFYKFHLDQIAPHAISCSQSSSRTPKKPQKTPPAPLAKGDGRGLDIKTAGTCQKLPPPPSHMRNPTCQCSEANALFGTTTYTTCLWVDK